MYVKIVKWIIQFWLRWKPNEGCSLILDLGPSHLEALAMPTLPRPRTTSSGTQISLRITSAQATTSARVDLMLLLQAINNSGRIPKCSYHRANRVRISWAQRQDGKILRRVKAEQRWLILGQVSMAKRQEMKALTILGSRGAITCFLPNNEQFAKNDKSFNFH